MTIIVQSYFDTLLRFMLSHKIMCGSAVLKVVDKKTLVKRE